MTVTENIWKECGYIQVEFSPVKLANEIFGNGFHGVIDMTNGKDVE
jgi:hypothetical protein